MRHHTVLAVVLILGIAVPALTNTGTVTEVLAGDLLVIGDGWKTRLTGIEVPGPETPIGYRAFDFTKRRIEGAVVVFATHTTDNTAAGIVYDREGLARATVRYGRDWSRNLAEDLLAAGLARVDETLLPEYCSHFRDIEAEAKRQGVGMWARP